VSKIEIGDFIKIPAWEIEGCVIDTRPSTLGSDEAQDVLLQEKPNDPHPRWYRLEPDEYELI
jgi:hypothetical protein